MCACSVCLVLMLMFSFRHSFLHSLSSVYRFSPESASVEYTSSLDYICLYFHLLQQISTFTQESFQWSLIQSPTLTFNVRCFHDGDAFRSNKQINIRRVSHVPVIIFLHMTL